MELSTASKPRPVLGLGKGTAPAALLPGSPESALATCSNAFRTPTSGL